MCAECFISTHCGAGSKYFSLPKENQKYGAWPGKKKRNEEMHGYFFFTYFIAVYWVCGYWSKVGFH